LEIGQVKHAVHFESVGGTTDVRRRNQFDCYGDRMLHLEAGLRRGVDRNRGRVSCGLFPSQLRQRAEGELLFATASDKAGQG
jgi:hypothetical protein